MRILHSDVGKVDEGRLQLLASIVAFLVQVLHLLLIHNSFYS